MEFEAKRYTAPRRPDLKLPNDGLPRDGLRYEWHFLKRNLQPWFMIDKDGLTCDKFGLPHNPRLLDKEAVGGSAYHPTDP
jgi:hypothetical protein